MGSAWTALASWALARAGGGTTVLRVEDIDRPRVVAGSADRISADLEWLGLEWDDGPIAQSMRTSIYEAALARLDAAGLVYPCDCSRAEIARVASAPHAEDETTETIYPRICRDAPADRPFKRPPALRLRVPDRSIVSFDDDVCGRVDEDVGRRVGDFVLRRGDGVFSYQLVVAVDDAAMGVSHVVRADDLLGSTARQLLLMELLGFGSKPNYVHVPLVVSSNGERLAKRTRGMSIRELAERGEDPETVIGALAYGLGLVDREGPRSPRDVARALRPPSLWRKTPWPMPDAWNKPGT